MSMLYLMLLSWFNLAAGNGDHADTHLLLPPRWNGKENEKK